MPTTEFSADIERQALPLKERLLTEPELAPLIEAARDAAGRYELALLTHDEHLNPEQHIANLKHRISTAKTYDEIAEIRTKIVLLSTEMNEARTVAQRLVAPVYDALRASLNAIHAKAVVIVEEYAEEAATAEMLHFAQFGLAPGKTEASARVERFKAELEQMNDGLGRMHSTHIPSSAHPALTYFLAGE